MCGITGIVSSNVLRLETNLKAMMQAIKHRGPDSSNHHLFENCALGHLRLSIIDLKTGDQPMFSNSEKNAIVFNGEMYGFQDIKNTIKNYQFRTTSDTEVILALYEKYGENFVSKLPGMFSFAIWNDKEQALICARDRFGEKPFYYAIGENGEFLFGSEIKALLASRLIKPVLNYSAVAHYMKHLYVSPRQTIYSNINILPPAHQLTYKNGKVSIKKYWHLPSSDFSVNSSEATEELKRLFMKSVNQQLVADVPVGVFLSGGLDSSTVLATASQFKRNIQTFSLGFEKGVDELPFAKIMAEKYGTCHNVLEDKKEDIAELLLQMQSIYDEPFADSSNIPTYLISKFAAKELKVVLTGDGGDELLAGYSWYHQLLKMQTPHKSQLRRTYLSAIKNGLGKINKRIESHYADEIKLSGMVDDGTYIANEHLNQNVYFSNKEIRDLGLKGVSEPLFDISMYNSNSLDDALRMDLEDYMPGDILVKTDRASMANGLELRSPFLDVDFASFCISLPYTLKINNSSDKIILKKAFDDLLPQQIKTRTKQGFGAPVEHWLKIESVNALKHKYLGDKKQKIFQVLSFDGIQEYIKRDNYKTWILLILAIWMDKYTFEF